jgi:hypothetical protein
MNRLATVATLLALGASACAFGDEEPAETAGSARTKTPDRKKSQARVVPRTLAASKTLATPSLGRGAVFLGQDAHAYNNDLGGQWAFRQCVAECRQ